MTLSSAGKTVNDLKSNSIKIQNKSRKISSTNENQKNEVLNSKDSINLISMEKKEEIDISETQGVRRGKCKWFNVAKGWGFITPNDDGEEVFVHQSVLQMSGFRSLGDQEEVEFECKLTERGLEATRVSGLEGKDCFGSTHRPRRKRRIRRIRCYNCGAFANHIAAKCSLGPQPKRCHHCKSENHLVADCPDKKVETKTPEVESEHEDGHSNAEKSERT